MRLSLRRSAILALAIGAMCASAAIAQVVVPGTTGTSKEMQNQAVRVGVLIQRSNTATAASGAATINGAGAGLVTTESITTAAGSAYTLTLTDSLIAATDLVFASVTNGSNSAGLPLLLRVTPAAGSVAIVVQNAHASAALNGTLKISFFVVKQTAFSAD